VFIHRFMVILVAFQFLTIVNVAAMNIVTYFILVWAMPSFLLGKCL
jgi:hypothetical protein